MDKNTTHPSKEKERSYIHWTSEMDCALSAALLVQQCLGNKTTNGWKGVAFKAAITALKNECHVNVSKENVMARLKTWNKYYREVSAMLESNGFSWDWDHNVVKFDSEEVWANYVKDHPTTKHYRDKVIVNWVDLPALCGTNRAPKANLSTGYKIMNDFDIEESVAEDVKAESSHRSKKKKANTIDALVEVVSSIAKSINQSLKSPTVVHAPTPMTSADKIYDALTRMPEFSEYEIIKAIDMLSTDERKCEVFMALPDRIRKTWLRVHLDD